MAEEPRPTGVTLFQITVPICAAVGAVGIAYPNAFGDAASFATNLFFGALDWFFIATVTGLVLLSLWLALGRYGRIKLGAPDEEPEFSTTSWLAMLFSAGMGVGLLFWGVAEPLSHFSGAPGSDPETPAAARRALVLTGLHWGLHAWAIYAMAALVIAYFGFRRHTPCLPGAPIRFAFARRWTPAVASTADLIAVIAVTFGVAGAVAMGILQLHSGLAITAGLDPDSVVISGGILGLLVIAYMTSAATSIDKGIKWLSNINMVLALALLLFTIAAGPTAYLFKSFVTSIGDYASNLVSLSFRLYPYEEGQKWLQDWTLTWLIWWIAWAPFVGVFIARISRGRTIREFVFGVVVIPTLFSLLWFAVFGGTALYEEIHGAGGIARLVREDVSVAMFSLFSRLPLSVVLSAISIMLVFVFLVTSVDSATYVLGMLTSRGSPNPATSRKITWGLILGLLSGALMLTGNVFAIRGVSVLGAIPFTCILILQLVSLLRALARDTGGEDGPVEQGAADRGAP